MVDDYFLQCREWRVVRMRALEKYGAKCQCCGATPEQGRRINVDHIKPRGNHPELALDITNLQILCEVCNHGKGNWSSRDWRQSTSPRPHTGTPAEEKERARQTELVRRALSGMGLK